MAGGRGGGMLVGWRLSVRVTQPSPRGRGLPMNSLQVGRGLRIDISWIGKCRNDFMTETTARIQHVTSADGTSIGVRCEGPGAPLLLVHGALCDASSWEPLVPFLSGAREVMALDRRGRGESGDAVEYKPGLEVDDVFAAAMGLHRDVDMLAHSSGR